MLPAGNYLLFGRTGTGKSSLINTIANAPLALTDQADACTNKINKYCFTTPCGLYTIYDSPGLCEDDNPATDEGYVATLNTFLSDPKICFDISIILAVRIGNQRVRSEDHDVAKYLAQLLACHPNSPVLLVATWAELDKSKEHNVKALEKLRMQYLLMLDKELLLASGREYCMHGFSGSYAVDNSLGAWLASWHPCCIESDFHNSFIYLEKIVGHPEKFIRDWIEATGHSPDCIKTNKVFHLVEARIFNLTHYPLDHDCQVDDLIRVTPQSLVQSPFCPEISLVYPIESTSLALAIDKANKLIQKRFRLRLSVDARAVLKDLPDNLRLSIFYLQKLSEGHGLSSHTSSHIVLLLSAREVISGLHYIATKRSMFILRPEVIAERMSFIKEILIDLFSRLGDTFLAGELRLLVELGLNFPLGSDFNSVTQHLINTSTILSLAVSFAELAYFPCSIRLYDLACPDPGLYPLVDLLNMDLRLHGYSKLVLDCLEEFDWSDFADLASFEPQCMRFLLGDILSFLQINQWLVPSNQLGKVALRNSVDIALYDESYWPSWRDEEDDSGPIPYYSEDWLLY